MVEKIFAIVDGLTRLKMHSQNTREDTQSQRKASRNVTFGQRIDRLARVRRVEGGSIVGADVSVFKWEVCQGLRLALREYELEPKYAS